MIQVVKHPDAGVEQQVRQYLSAAAPETGACGEHDPAWLAVLREGLGQRPYMLVARRGAGSEADGEIRGYLPLALVSSTLFGKFLVSLPYLNRAGIVADDEHVAAELVDQAVALADELNVKYLELRHHNRVEEHAKLDQNKTGKVRMVLDLPESEETLWTDLSAKVRNQVRKGDKFDLSLRWGGRELLDDFYTVFAVNMRDLGTPVYSRKLFAKTLHHLPDQAELAVVDHAGQPIAGALLIHGRDQTQVPSASTLRQFNHTNANMWMYYRLLTRAIERGQKQFDFGRSSEGAGTYRFKKQWGSKPYPTVWQYHIRHGDTAAMRPDSDSNRRRVETWKKLPVWLTRLVGPSIVRGIP